MAESWIHFASVIVTQLLVFIVCARSLGRIGDIPRLLVHGIPVGVVCGVSFDLFFGKYLGLSSYELGFGMPFLVLNGALAYGIFAANVLLLEHTSFAHFCVLTACIMMVYEAANFFFPVWQWNFGLTLLPLWAVLFAGYVRCAFLILLAGRLFLGYRPRFDLFGQ